MQQSLSSLYISRSSIFEFEMSFEYYFFLLVFFQGIIWIPMYEPLYLWMKPKKKTVTKTLTIFKKKNENHWFYQFESKIPFADSAHRFGNFVYVL